MSGVEFMFLDGGVTVSALVGAGLGALGYKQHKKDENELADVTEVNVLREELRIARVLVYERHRKVGETWRGPISLFDDRSETVALERGVPNWAIACVRKGQKLADAVAELVDRADVYDTQLSLAERDGIGLLRQPVRELVMQLDELAEKLSVHLISLEMARAAFDDPVSAPQFTGVSSSSSSVGVASAADGRLQLGYNGHRLNLHYEASKLNRDPSAARASSCGRNEVVGEEAPMAILRNRKRLGELYGGMQARGHQVLEALRSSDRMQEPEPPREAELNAWVLQYGGLAV